MCSSYCPSHEWRWGKQQENEWVNGWTDNILAGIDIEQSFAYPRLSRHPNLHLALKALNFKHISMSCCSACSVQGKGNNNLLISAMVDHRMYVHVRHAVFGYCPILNNRTILGNSLLATQLWFNSCRTFLCSSIVSCNGGSCKEREWREIRREPNNESKKAGVDMHNLMACPVLQQ